MQQRPGLPGGGTWAAFLAMAFLVVGLTGIFATYAAPIPLERVLARDAALDRLLAAPDPAKALDALRAELGDSADALAKAPGDLGERVARERGAMRVRLGREFAAVGLRLRLMIGVFTFAGALFGIAVLSIVRRLPASDPAGCKKR